MSVRSRLAAGFLCALITAFLLTAFPSRSVAGAPISRATMTTTPQAQPPGNRSWVVAVDPGHGGKESGAVSRWGLTEKSVNLKIALKLAALLKRGGYRPVLTRSSDRAVNTRGRDLNGNGVVNNDDDLQARVDIANAAHADIFVSIHNNSSANPSVKGTITYYSANRSFAAQNMRLASALQHRIVASLRTVGYNAFDKGISDDAPLKKPFGHLFLIGPLTPRVARASNMPGALGETLYLSNPPEGALLAKDSVLSAIAEGYYLGIRDYFGSW